VLPKTTQGPLRLPKTEVSLAALQVSRQMASFFTLLGHTEPETREGLPATSVQVSRLSGFGYDMLHGVHGASIY
jgi:hypothetical protein